MSPAGCIDVDTTPPGFPGSSWPSYGSKLTVQAFVKSVALTPGIGGTFALVEDPGRFLLRLNSDGSVTAQVTVTSAGGQVTKQVTSAAGVVPPNEILVDPGAGWRHLTMVYDGSGPTVSKLRLYGEDVLLASVQWAGFTTIAAAPSETLHVGPGRGPASQPVNVGNMVLVLDEVAISGVARTLAEIRRDAYLLPQPATFEPVPSQIADDLPAGLDPAETRWPVGVAFDAAKVALGDALFESPLLSKPLPPLPPPQQRSCASCHDPADFLTNNQLVATAWQGGAALPFNTPTALNMAFGTHKLFDGSAATLEQQVVRPITGPEMGPQTMSSVLNRIKNEPQGDLLELFTLAYGDLDGDAQVNEANLKESLAMYVRTLVSGGSDYDLDAELREVPSEAGAPLTALQQQGRALFFGKARCFGCHRGSNFSDDDFHNIRTVEPSESILGRGGFTQRTTENGQVKTPTLRNVQWTGPYFHDGSKSSLADVIDHYVIGFTTSSAVGPPDRQLRPLDLDEDEQLALEEFLRSLTGSE